jgi:bifunctional enzyme CysN/CysC
MEKKFDFMQRKDLLVCDAPSSDTRSTSPLSRENRERLKGHHGRVIWFTGLSGAGKSTMANTLESSLHARGFHTYILDGDNMRLGLNRDLGFTPADRAESCRRTAEVARLMMDAGLVVIAALISPFRKEREMARSLIGEDRFFEVYVDTPLAICEQRDTKGLYRKARNREIADMTGIDSPYEPPERPQMRTGPDEPLEDAVVRLMVLLNFS